MRSEVSMREQSSSQKCDETGRCFTGEAPTDAELLVDHELAAVAGRVSIVVSRQRVAEAFERVEKVGLASRRRTSAWRRARACLEQERQHP